MRFTGGRASIFCTYRNKRAVRDIALMLNCNLGKSDNVQVELVVRNERVRCCYYPHKPIGYVKIVQGIPRRFVLYDGKEIIERTTFRVVQIADGTLALYLRLPDMSFSMRRHSVGFRFIKKAHCPVGRLRYASGRGYGTSNYHTIWWVQRRFF